jgi:hypothetical protein
MRLPSRDIAIATSILKKPDHFFLSLRSGNFSLCMDERPDLSPACPVRGLPPLHGELPDVLILSSFPSRQSLEKKEYYGNPMNHFWHILEASFSIDRHLPP